MTLLSYDKVQISVGLHLQVCSTCHHRRHDLRQYQPGRGHDQVIQALQQFYQSQYGTSTGSNNWWTFLINVSESNDGLLHFLCILSLTMCGANNRVFELNIQSNQLPILREGSKTQMRRQFQTTLGSALVCITSDDQLFIVFPLLMSPDGFQ
jgi:hypothetical protein